MSGSNDLALKVLLTAQDQASGTIKGFGSTLAAFAGDAGPLVTGLFAVGAAVAGIGIAATKMAADYDQKMRMVQSLTGASNQQMQQYDAGLKALAIDAGVAPVKLTDGLYNVLSASYKGADAMRVLTLATEDSKIGMTNAKVTTDALTNILRSFSVQAGDATRVNGEMLETVTLGKATFEQYATTIVKSASAANQFHVSMETMNAAWSTMTSSGIRAAQASTDFQQSLKVMYGNIGTVTASLHKNKIAFDEAKFNTMDYGHKVQYLNTALEEANAKHVKVIGVTLQASQAVSTISKHIGDYNSNLATLSDKQAMSNKTAEAWKITQGGLNQTMDRLKAVISVLLIDIGQHLVPVFTALANAAIPAIEGITSNGEKLVSFFAHNQTAMDALKATLIAFAAIVASILIPAFVAWAIAMIPVVIETLLVAAPFILAGIIIAAVVFGIIEVVRNWGAISKWLVGAWKAAISWLGGAVHSIADFFVGVWHKIQSATSTTWSFLVNIVKTGVHLLLNVITAPFRAIGALFVWLYNHNTYFKRLIDTITSIVKAGLSWLQSAFHAALSWIVDKINWFVNLNKQEFNMIYTTIKTVLTDVYNFVQGIVTTILNFFSQQWNKAVQLVTQLWQKISSIFRSAWSSFIQSPLGQLLQNIVAFFQKLPGMALTWGENMIKGFISGILNMIGGVGNAVGQIASKVGSFLGFHSPAKEGPGAELDQWPKNMVKSYAKTLTDQAPVMKQAVSVLANQFTMLNGNVHPMPASAGGSATPQGGGGTGQITYMNITINAGNASAKDVAKEIKALYDRDLRRSGNLVTITSGGKA